MTRAAGKDAIPTCPFIDCGDARCSQRLCLKRLGQAFDVCLGEYQSCPIYWQLAREQSMANEAEAAIVSAATSRIVFS